MTSGIHSAHRDLLAVNPRVLKNRVSVVVFSPMSKSPEISRFYVVRSREQHVESPLLDLLPTPR